MTSQPSFAIVGLSFLCATLFSVLSLYRNPRVRDVLRRDLGYVVLILLVNIAFKLPLDLPFFDGLEYEDAYVYKASARYMLEKMGGPQTQASYLTESCVFGSLQNCIYSGTYSGHLIGFPCVISLCYSIFGFRPDVANIISLFLSCLAVVVIYLICRALIGERKYGIICCFLFVTTPIFNAYSAVTFAEVVSNFGLSLLLLEYILWVHCIPYKTDSKFSGELLPLISLFFLMAFVTQIKRENLVMLLCVPIASVTVLLLERKPNMAKEAIFRLLKIGPGIIIVSLFSLGEMKVISTLWPEEIEIGHAAFSIRYLASLFPAFLSGFLTMKWYLFYSVFLFAGVVLCPIDRRWLLPSLAFVAYLILYTTHYRSYDFVEYGEVSHLYAIRYMIGLSTFYCLIAGGAIYAIGSRYGSRVVKGVHRRPVVLVTVCIVAVAICAVAFGLSRDLRASHAEEERQRLVQPVLNVIKVFRGKDVTIVTPYTLLYQIYGEPGQKTVDVNSLSHKALADTLIEAIKAGDFVVYAEQDSALSANDRARLQVQYGLIDRLKRDLLYTERGISVFRLKITANPNSHEGTESRFLKFEVKGMG